MELMQLAGASIAGGAVGAAYFTGLWATVRALPKARHPALVVFASFVGRLALAGACFLGLVRAGGWPWAAAGLAGFVLARTAVVGRLRPDGPVTRGPGP